MGVSASNFEFKVTPFRLAVGCTILVAVGVGVGVYVSRRAQAHSTVVAAPGRAATAARQQCRPAAMLSRVGVPSWMADIIETAADAAADFPEVESAPAPPLIENSAVRVGELAREASQAARAGARARNARATKAVAERMEAHTPHEARVHKAFKTIVQNAGGRAECVTGVRLFQSSTDGLIRFSSFYEDPDSSTTLGVRCLAKHECEYPNARHISKEEFDATIWHLDALKTTIERQDGVAVVYVPCSARELPAITGAFRDQMKGYQLARGR